MCTRNYRSIDIVAVATRRVDITSKEHEFVEQSNHIEIAMRTIRGNREVLPSNHSKVQTAGILMTWEVCCK